MPLDEQDQHTITAIINWFAKAALAKYERGVHEHGGTLVAKGGLFGESEAETLDHVIYQQAIRRQLELVERLLDSGRPEHARHALWLILHGKPSDRLPE